MQHSSFDLAVFAKTYQEFRLKEAEKVRQLDEAQASRPSARLARGGLFDSIRSWFSRQSAPLPESPAAVSPYLSMGPLADGAPFGRARPGTQSIRAAEPYAAMVVLARASAAPVKEEPAVRDC